MNRFKTALLLATAAGCVMNASLVQAQTVNVPAPNSANGSELRGAGASSVQNVLVQEFNCIAKHNDLGVYTNSTTAGTLSTIAEPTNLPTSFDCSTTDLEPNANAKYLSTGSGTGRAAWLATSNAFGSGNPHGTWNTVQFAFSDGPVTSSELSTYNSNIAPSIGGPAVQFPKYVLPVAIAYNPQYGTTGSVALNFNVTGGTRQILGVNAGGLRLNAATYCGIFNGTIKNWNDSAITTDNGGNTLMSASDNSARWTAEGVPIRIVGRVDRSGTTDIFTRHLAAVCPSLVASNKFTSAAETLPYSRGVSGTPDFSSVRSDTGLSASSTATVAGSSNSVSNTYWNGSGFSSVSGGTSATPTTVSGAGSALNGSGLFIVANGSSGVAAAINYAPDVASQYSGTTGYSFNGKVGYISADFVPPSGTTGLYAAALKGTSGAGGSASAYRMPTAADAAAAVGIIQPPQTNSSGAYDTSYTAGGLRSDPNAWYNALYAGTSSLANPGTGGYAITGTTQFDGYTCYLSGNLENIKNFIGWNTGLVTTDYAGTSHAGLFTTSGSSVAASGLLPRSNIGAMPAIWQSAINQSFLTGSDGLGLQFTLAGSGSCSGKSGR